jgi:hypothetical protein
MSWPNPQVSRLPAHQTIVRHIVTSTLAQSSQVNAPHGASSTHRTAAIAAVANIAAAVAIMLISTNFGIGALLGWAFLGEILVVAGAFTSFWSMISRLRCTQLDGNAAPKFHMWNAPGSHWTFASNAGREMSQDEVNKVEPEFRTHIYVWRSVRLSLAYTGIGVTLAGAALIAYSGYVNNLF